MGGKVKINCRYAGVQVGGGGEISNKNEQHKPARRMLVPFVLRNSQFPYLFISFIFWICAPNRHNGGI